MALGPTEDAKNMSDIPRLMDLEDTMDFADEQRKINQINLVTKAIYTYEKIRYRNYPVHYRSIAFDAALNEVLKQMGLED